MKNVANTIEDLLEIFAGLQGQSKMQIESSDVTIMYSVARQTFKGTALTDRQYALMKEKLQNYRDQFTALDYDFDRAIDSLRQPLRQIDRSKYIKIVNTHEVFGDNNVYESYKSKWKWIEVRFPFSKKLITSINTITSKINEDQHYHQRGTHKHFFALNDRTVKLIIPEFLEKDFIIEEDIIQHYKKIKDVKMLDFYPTFINEELINVSESLKATIQTETDDNKFKIADRRFRYGISIPDLDSYNNVGIQSKIIKRRDTTYHSNPKEQMFKEIMDALCSLDRFPMVVILDNKNAENQLYEFWDYFRYIIPIEQQSVMFRLDNTSNQEFNLFVKEKGLNNTVDKNTKVVYINSINKVVIRSGWKPITAFSYSSSIDRSLDSYISETCDLVIFREEQMSPFRRYSRYYG